MPGQATGFVQSSWCVTRNIRSFADCNVQQIGTAVLAEDPSTKTLGCMQRRVIYCSQDPTCIHKEQVTFHTFLHEWMLCTSLNYSLALNCEVWCCILVHITDWNSCGRISVVSVSCLLTSPSNWILFYLHYWGLLAYVLVKPRSPWMAHAMNMTLHDWICHDLQCWPILSVKTKE